MNRRNPSVANTTESLLIPCRTMSYQAYVQLQRCLSLHVCGCAFCRREPSLTAAQRPCEGSACSFPTSSARLPVDVDASPYGSSGAPPARVVQMAGGRVISRLGAGLQLPNVAGRKGRGRCRGLECNKAPAPKTRAVLCVAPARDSRLE